MSCEMSFSQLIFKVTIFSLATILKCLQNITSLKIHPIISNAKPSFVRFHFFLWTRAGSNSPRQVGQLAPGWGECAPSVVPPLGVGELMQVNGSTESVYAHSVLSIQNCSFHSIHIGISVLIIM